MQLLPTSALLNSHSMGRIVFAVSAGIAWLVYFWTSAPGLGLVDSGELTTVTKTLGIAHPTGYPLYTLLGRVWHLTIPADPARAMVLFSVTCAALGIGVLANASFRLLQRTSSLSNSLSAVCAVGLSTGLTFSYSVWTAVAFAEVYPLTFVIASLLIWICARVYLAESSETVPFVLSGFYLWGLGFGNHLTILWFFPLLLWLAVRFVRAYERSIVPMLVLIAAFICGASVNLFLPLRSSVEPLLDWSDPQTFSNLLRHLTAWQYRVWMFEGDFNNFIGAFGAYLGTLPRDLGWIVTLLSALGLLLAIIRRQWLLICVFATWLIGVAYNLNYSIPDISTYFVSFYAPLFMLAVFAVGWVAQRLAVMPGRVIVVVALSCLPGVVAFASSYRVADKHADTFATDHARAVLATLPDSAIVFHGNWDIQSPVLYLQSIKGEREDVAMFDLALMQRPWYLKQEQRRYPAIFAECTSSVEAFVHAVRPFEAGEPYDAQRLEAAYVDMINCLIEHHYRDRPVYVRDTRAIGHPGIGAELPAYPAGYFFRIADSSMPEVMINPDLLQQSGVDRDERVSQLFRQAAMATVLRGQFSLQQGDTSAARECVRVSTRLAPEDRNVRQFAAQLAAATGNVQ